MAYRQGACLEELCPVCGDKVSGYHYGLLTCESCKGFFKRTVQNSKKYTCVENQQCRIDKTQRKRCPFCRFQKCLNVGMRLEAVRADRMRGGRNKFGPMYKRDRALKQQRNSFIQNRRFRLDSSSLLASTSQQSDPPPVAICYSLTTNQPPSLSTLLPSALPAANQYQCTPSSDWTIKSENSNNCACLSGSAAGSYIHSDDPHSTPFSTQGPRMPQLVMEFLRCDPDESQLQDKITTRLQQVHGDHDTFSLMCVMADETLCSIVEWARASIFFKQLEVSDQMKLLHHCWSELLLLDIISRQVLYGKEGSLLLVTRQEVELSDIICHADPSLATLVLQGQELIQRFQILKADRQEFVCIKFLILFNPDVKELEDRGFVESVQEQVEGALLEYTLISSPQYLGRFTHLLLCLSELRSLSALAEDYLYRRQLNSQITCNNLLIEMLHAKHSWR